MPNSTEPQREGFGAYVRAKNFSRLSASKLPSVVVSCSQPTPFER
jgi:hypothetical protein